MKPKRFVRFDLTYSYASTPRAAEVARVISLLERDKTVFIVDGPQVLE
jgi:hypothetical protein